MHIQKKFLHQVKTDTFMFCIQIIISCGCVVFPQLRSIYNAIGVEYFYD
jgi:hypothetical protein